MNVLVAQFVKHLLDFVDWFYESWVFDCLFDSLDYSERVIVVASRPQDWYKLGKIQVFKFDGQGRHRELLIDNAIEDNGQFHLFNITALAQRNEISVQL